MDRGLSLYPGQSLPPGPIDLIAAPMDRTSQGLSLGAPSLSLGLSLGAPSLSLGLGALCLGAPIRSLGPGALCPAHPILGILGHPIAGGMKELKQS